MSSTWQSYPAQPAQNSYQPVPYNSSHNGHPGGYGNANSSSNSRQPSQISQQQQQQQSRRRSEWDEPTQREKRKQQQLEKHKRKKREGKKRKRSEKKHKRDESKAPEPVMAKKKSEFLCTVKYRTRLHGPPLGPKLMQFDFTPNRLTRFCGSALELKHTWQFHEDADLGIPIDMIDPNAYRSSVSGRWRVGHSTNFKNVKQEGSTLITSSFNSDVTDRGWIIGNHVVLGDLRGEISESGFQIRWGDDTVWTKEEGNLDPEDRALLEEDEPAKKQHKFSKPTAPFLLSTRLIQSYGDGNKNAGNDFDLSKPAVDASVLTSNVDSGRTIDDEFTYVANLKEDNHRTKAGVVVHSAKPVFLSSLKENDYTLVQFANNPATFVSKKAFVKNKVSFPDPTGGDQESNPSAWRYMTESVLRSHDVFGKTVYSLYVPKKPSNHGQNFTGEYVSDFDETVPPKAMEARDQCFFVESNHSVEMCTFRNKLIVRKRARGRDVEALKRFDTLPPNIEVSFGSDNSSTGSDDESL